MTTLWSNTPNGHLLVDSVWLADHLNDPDLRIFDCTTRLVPNNDGGYDTGEARDNWTAGHIPGAVRLGERVGRIRVPAAKLCATA